jgi:hypothetical protein
MAVYQNITVTEVAGSANVSENTSKVRILWTSKQMGESWNGYTRTAKYYVSINGGAETAYSVSYTLPKNTLVTIVDATITVTHKSDGTATVHVRTWMDTGISAGEVTMLKSLTLTKIPRESVITSAKTIDLGGSCHITFTPSSSSYWYKISFLCGNWYGETKKFRPGTIAPYIFNRYTIPIEVAEQFPNSQSGTMTALLVTYDETSEKQIGTSEKSFTVWLPEDESTKPTIEMTLSPDTPYTKFASLYLQGRSKVKASFSGEGKLGASISSYTMQVEGASYASPYTSGILKSSGKVTVTGKVTDSRGFTRSITEEIDVIAYETPYIAPYPYYNQVICERCIIEDDEPEPSDSGTYLHVKGMRNFTKINVDGIVNTCSVRCRYKPEKGGWSHGAGDGVSVLLWTNTTTDEFDVVVDDIYLDTKLSYTVELNITDDTYLPTTMEFEILSEDVVFHLREGGKGAAFGKFATQENLLECEWDARFNGKLFLGDAEINAVIEQGTKSVNAVIEQGTKSVNAVIEQGKDGYTEVVWHYRKWLDGSLECRCRRNVTVNVNMAWGSALFYGMATTINYPFKFIERPITQISCEYGDTESSLFIASSGTGTNVYATPVMLCRTDSKSVNCNILYHAHGRWK